MPLLLVLKELFPTADAPYTLAEITERLKVVDETMNYQKVHRAYTYLKGTSIAAQVKPQRQPDYSDSRILYFSSASCARIGRRALTTQIKKKIRDNYSKSNQ